MKASKTFLLCVGCWLIALQAAAQSVPFLDHFAPTSNNGGSGIVSLAMAPNGELYALGIFSDAMDADPGAGSTVLSSQGDFDMFILKLDGAGQLIWAQSLGGPGEDQPTAIGTDASGNVYLAGGMRDSMDLDPGPAVTMAYSAGFRDIFLISLSPNGQFRWGHVIGGPSEDNAAAMAVRSNGTVAITGYFADTVDFDPAGTAELYSHGGSDIYVAQYDHSGDFQWTSLIGGGYTDEAAGIAMDSIGNVFLTGFFQDTVDFDPAPANVFQLISGPNNFDLEIFVCKLDSGGGLVWAKSIGGADPDGGDYGSAIAVDAQGDCYSTGQFDATADFDPDSVNIHNLTADVYQDGYLLKLTSAGDFVYAVPLNGSGAERCLALKPNAAGEVFATGYFDDTLDADPGPGYLPFTCNDIEHAFFLHVDGSGSLIEGHQVWADFSDGSCVTLDDNGNPVFGGFFNGVAHFDSLQGQQTLYGQGYFDGFVWREPFVATAVPAAISDQDFTVFPNPVSDLLHLTLPNGTVGQPIRLEFFNILGDQLITREVNAAVSITVGVQGLPAGLYILRATAEGGEWQSRFLKL